MPRRRYWAVPPLDAMNSTDREAVWGLSRPAPEVGNGDFPPLTPGKFSGKIESEFRAWFYTSQMQRAHVSLGLAQALVFASVGLDLINSPDVAERLAALTKLVLISPLLLATMWISRKPRWRHLFPHFMCASIVAVGAAFSLVNIGGAGFGISLRYDALVLVTVFTYFLGGLASVFACATGLVLLALHIFLSSLRDVALETMAYESLFLLAVNAIGMLSANMTEQSVREAFWRYTTMTQLSELDALTQMLNRRGFDRRYAEIWEKAQRDNRPLAVAFIDIDHFKNVNDRYGHEAGDQALKAVAQVISRTDPPPQLCARLGGDEFVAVWYDLARPSAEQLAARVPRAVEALQIPNEGATHPVLTVSVGLNACQPDPSALAGDCMRRADQALYRAKQAGRNRFEVVV
jgi:diguanylate cyclase (GGDEF)-like protein